MISGKSWSTGEAPGAGKKANVVPTVKMGEQDSPGNDRSVKLTLILDKTTEQQDLITEELKRSNTINANQDEFVENRTRFKLVSRR